MAEVLGFLSIFNRCYHRQGLSILKDIFFTTYWIIKHTESRYYCRLRIKYTRTSYKIKLLNVSDKFVHIFLLLITIPHVHQMF